MKNKFTEIVFILDKSGSMSGMESDTIGGFNSMIEKQKEKDAKVYVSTILFSNNFEVLHDRVSLDEIEPLTTNDYKVGGSTALVDAIGRSIRHIKNAHKYARKEDIPDQTLFVITTDGEENASREFSASRVKAMIKEQEENHGWTFMFLASNIDAVTEGEKIGFRRDRVVDYKVRENTPHMYAKMSDALSAYLVSGDIDIENF